MAFDPNADLHTHANGLFLAESSQLAYHPEGAAAWLLRNGFANSTAQPFDVRGVSGMTVVDPQFTLISFTGTNSLEDWGINLKTRPVADAGGLPGKLHRGFVKALDQVWAAAVNPLLGRPVPLWVTGHSLGGALAVLAAARCALVTGQPVRGLYTYGQPRVGNHDLRDAIDVSLAGRYFRYVNDRDIVPRVPPATLGYRHAGHSFLFTEDGAVREVSPAQEAIFALQRALEEAGHVDRLNGPELLESVSDHSIDSYLACLRRVVGMA